MWKKTTLRLSIIKTDQHSIKLMIISHVTLCTRESQTKSVNNIFIWEFKNGTCDNTVRSTRNTRRL